MDYREMARALRRINWQQDNSRNALIRDYAAGNIVPAPKPAPRLTPLDVTGPKPTRLNMRSKANGRIV